MRLFIMVQTFLWVMQIAEKTYHILKNGKSYILATMGILALMDLYISKEGNRVLLR